MKLLKPDSPAASAPTGRVPDRLQPVDFLVLAVAAFHWPLGIMAENHWQVVHLERVIAVVVGVAAVASLIALSWVRLGGDRRTVVFTVFIATVFTMRGGPLLWSYGTLTGWAIIAGAVLIAGYIGHRLRDEPILGVVTVVLVVILGSGPLIGGIGSLESGASQVARSEDPEVHLTQKPDVFLVVLDGYPGHIALRHEFGVSKPDLVTDLRDRGFQVPESAWTPYWTTERAVPAILDMSYPAPAGAMTQATYRELHEMVAGENNVVDVFVDNGYETTMLEAGWVGSSCGPVFDHCVPSAWFDELGFSAAFETVFTQQLVGRFGNAFTAGSVNTMENLREIAVAPDGESPRFVFAHVVAPHPPYFLDENCQITPSLARIRASAFTSPFQEETVGNFLSQAACVDRFMAELADLVDDDDVIVFVGDHGTDRRKPLLDGADSDPAAVIERMNVLVAARVEPGCDLGDELLTSNLMPRVLSCYAESPVPDAEERIFLPGYELSDPEVRRLLEEATFVNADGSIARGS